MSSLGFFELLEILRAFFELLEILRVFFELLEILRFFFLGGGGAFFRLIRKVSARRPHDSQGF